MINPWLAVKQFEESICKFTNSKYAVAVDSCTNAIFLSLMFYKTVMNREFNDTVIIPNRTYISVPMQVLNAGLKLDFNDNEWYAYYKLYNTPVIDSAQWFEQNMYIKDSLQCVSFQYKKHLPIGRGGAILTDNIDAYNWFIKARHDGRNMYEDYGSIQKVDMIGYHYPLLPHEAIRGQELLLNTNLTCHNIPGCYLNYKPINTDIFNEDFNNR